MTQIVLDHGYVKIIEHWGSDERIIEAARMSTDKGFLGWGDFVACKECVGNGLVFSHWDAQLKDTVHIACPACDGRGGSGTRGDEKLLGYLYKNKHMTPFEMAGLVIEVQAPIFVFREWHRHRAQSYNEMSARYTPLPDLNYIPTVERLLINSKTNKQAGTIKGAAELDEWGANLYRADLALMYENQERFYQQSLSNGIPKELARNHLPVGRYSKMRASTCLRNWLAFLTLRADSHAQWEIRQFAFAVQEILEGIFPRTLDLFSGKC